MGQNGEVRSIPTFLGVAAAVTLVPGPAFALLLQVAAVHGRRAALANIAGNSLGVLAWGLLSAAGVSALIAANQLAYDALRLSGAAFLLWMGGRALVGTRSRTPAIAVSGPIAGRQGSLQPIWPAARRGLVNSLANPKLAVFFVALFPQFLTPGTQVLPAAMGMAGVIVAFDVLWYGMVAVVVDRFRQVLQPRVLRRVERAGGAILLALGIRLATEAR